MITKGIIAIDKPKDWTSFDVVNKIKHIVKPNKVGHLGTLDPMATGVLLVTLGKMTKLFDIAQKKTKTYVAKFTFGYTTDTLDDTGSIIERTSYIPTIQEIESSIENLIGDIDQIPPKYSAKSVGGIRAYDLARKGVEFDLQPKRVHIDFIQVISYNQPVLELKITCGSGTYIRSIGRDIARSSNSLASMTELVRTDIGTINIADCIAITKDTTEQDLVKAVVPLEKVLQLDTIEMDSNLVRLLNGQLVNCCKPDGDYILKSKNDDMAIVNIKKNIAKMTIYLE